MGSWQEREKKAKEQERSETIGFIVWTGGLIAAIGAFSWLALKLELEF